MLHRLVRFVVIIKGKSRISGFFFASDGLYIGGDKFTAQYNSSFISFRFQCIKCMDSNRAVPDI